MTTEPKGWMTVGELAELLGRADRHMRVRVAVGGHEHEVDDDATGFTFGSGDDRFYIAAGERVREVG